jgi:hypothetical protein
MKSSLIALTVGLGFVFGTLVNVADKIDPQNTYALISLAIIGAVPALVSWLVLRVVTLGREVLR